MMQNGSFLLLGLMTFALFVGSAGIECQYGFISYRGASITKKTCDHAAECFAVPCITGSTVNSPRAMVWGCLDSKKAQECKVYTASETKVSTSIFAEYFPEAKDKKDFSLHCFTCQLGKYGKSMDNTRFRDAGADKYWKYQMGAPVGGSTCNSVALSLMLLAFLASVRAVFGQIFGGNF
uniref:Transmembrane protein n=1 Tax=Globodera rostochiensis TaxID=31243 RepID=A0A914HW36_GLORO